MEKEVIAEEILQSLKQQHPEISLKEQSQALRFAWYRTWKQLNNERVMKE